MSMFDSYGSDAVYFEAVKANRELRMRQVELLLQASESVVLRKIFGGVIRDRVNFPELKDQQVALALAEDYVGQAGGRYKSEEAASKYVGQIVSLHETTKRAEAIS